MLKYNFYKYAWLNELVQHPNVRNIISIQHKAICSNNALPSEIRVIAEKISSQSFLLELNNVTVLIKRIGNNRDIRVEFILDNETLLREPLGKLYDRYIERRFGYGTAHANGIEIAEFNEVQEITDPFFFINGRDNYSHFIYDFLPRHFIKTQFPQFRELPTLYVYANSYQEEILNKFNVSNRSAIPDSDKDCILFFRYLVVPTSAPIHFSYMSYQNLIREYFANVKPKNKIAIWKSSGNERVLNTSDVQDFLERHDYENYFPQRQNFSEVIKKLASASELVFFGDGSSANSYFTPRESGKILLINSDFLYSLDVTLQAPLAPLVPLENLRLLAQEPTLLDKSAQYSKYLVQLEQLEFMLA
jgi:hypothetical protein